MKVDLISENFFPSFFIQVNTAGVIDQSTLNLEVAIRAHNCALVGERPVFFAFFFNSSAFHGIPKVLVRELFYECSTF